jgi:RimJ/RimL family protein N-acetyltransferase
MVRESSEWLKSRESRNSVTMLPVLRTERLRLEPLSEDHAAAFLAYHERNRAHLQLWEPARDESFYPLETQQAQIRASEEDAHRGSCARFVAFVDDNAEIIASVNLWNIRRGVIHCAIVGYSVDARYVGRGYATESAGAVVRYAFDAVAAYFASWASSWKATRATICSLTARGATASLSALPTRTGVPRTLRDSRKQPANTFAR